MNNRIIIVKSLFLFAIAFCISIAGAENAPKKVTIQLPGNEKMNFCAVYLGINGERIFDSRQISLGSREENIGDYYKEQMADTLLSGSFVGLRNNKKDWLYYLAETEVTRGQWNAVMNGSNEAIGSGGRNDSQFPQTEITIAEIYLFIEKLNTWMLSNQREHLPKYRNAVAFCRLPTEAEWEFAARGGIEVDSNRFDRRYPYVDDHGNENPGDHEWFRSTSGSRVQECKSPNIEPNPIGLYDMLGNVEELTLSLFGPEYLQGRFGQFVIRGGNYSTDESKLSASFRTEYQSHPEGGGEPLKPVKVGFRLALSTRITSSGYLSEELDEGYQKYCETKTLTQPGPSGMSSASAQAEQDLLDSRKERFERIFSENQRLTEEIGRLQTEKDKAQVELRLTQNDNEELLKKISRIEKELEEMSKRKLAAEKQDYDSFLVLQNKQLKARINELEQNLRKNQSIVLTDTRMREELARKEQEVADLKRQITQHDHELAKNAGRVRGVEKRYLEALMRQASANAYLGYKALKRLSLLKDKMPPEVAETTLEEGSRMVNDYWALTVQIANETQAVLFPEVKAELGEWLKTKEKEGVSKLQHKALDLLERHVSDVRKGRYHRPEDLIRSFPQEPEFK